MCPEIVPMGFGEKTDEVIQKIHNIIADKASYKLESDVVYNDIGRIAKVRDQAGNDAPYILVRGLRSEEQLVELFDDVLENANPKYLGYEWEVGDLLLFVDKKGVRYGPGVK